MTSVWARLATLATAVLALDARQSSPSIRKCKSEPGSRPAIGSGTRWADPIPGTKAVFGLQERVLDLAKRDCLTNGSNYCFGNNVDYCPGCGNCCVDGKYCCGRGKLCCGSGCCSSDQVCSQGVCLPTVAPVTVTSVILQTVTRVATQRATVVIAEIESSTAISTIDVTTSSAATQTNVVWVTATTVVKRTVSIEASSQPSKRVAGLLVPALSRTSALRRWNSVIGRPHPTLTSAAHIQRQLSQGAAPTVTHYVTRTTDVTSITSVIVTEHTTSTILTTVYQTNTRVLKAEATVHITSTITITSHPPSVVTLSTTTNLILPATTSSSLPARPSSSATPEPDPPPQHLSTSAVAGIAAGSSVLALLLTLFVILSIRRRRRQGHSSRHHLAENPPTFDGRRSGGMRKTNDMAYHPQPTLPRIPSILPHFANIAPAHHAAQFQPPSSIVALTTARQRQQPDGCLDALRHGHGHGHGYDQTRYHQRKSSGFTTLVGTPGSSPSPAVIWDSGSGNMDGGGSKQEGDHHYHHHHHHGHCHHAGIAEVQGSFRGTYVEMGTEKKVTRSRGSGSGLPPVHVDVPGRGESHVLSSEREAPVGELQGDEAAPVELLGEGVRRG